MHAHSPMADAMVNCQKGTLVDAIAMLSRFQGTMGLSRSSNMIFQPSAVCAPPQGSGFRVSPLSEWLV
jgi:hypothetical protein